MKIIFTVFLLLCFIVQTPKVFAQNEEALKIVPSGNVGIGVSEPKEKLEVNGRIKDKTGWVMPVGSIIAFTGTTPPQGWLLRDGASYDKISDKSELHGVIGEVYGSTDNQFKVPDLRQTFVMGADSNVDNDSLGRRGAPNQHMHNVDLPQIRLSIDPAGEHNHKFPPNWAYQTWVKSVTERGL